MVVSRSVHIAAPVERVFALVSDPLARSRLSPHATPLRVEIEGDSALRLGSVCHFRLQIGQQIVDYRTRVQAFEAGRRIVSVSDTTVPFEITVETVAEDGGTRLTQSETFEPTEDMLIDAAGPAGRGERLGRLLQAVLPWIDSDYALSERQRREDLLRRKLEARLEAWLAAIRRQLETGTR